MLNLDILETLLGESYKTDTENEYRFNCPVCDDTKHRLYVNLMKHKYICFNENCLIDLARADIKITQTKPSELRDVNIGTTNKELKVSEITYPDSIIEPCVDDQYRPYWDYLFSRGLTNSDIVQHRMMFGKINTENNNRVIFPVYYNDALVYYQARTISNSVPKYLGAKVSESNKKSYFLVNFDKAKLSDTVIVCEGYLDAVFAGGNAVALLGKFCSNRQFDLLISNWNNFILALDGDAKDYNLFLYEKLKRQGKSVKVIFLGDKDVADLGSEDFKQKCNSVNYSVYDNLKSRLLVSG